MHYLLFYEKAADHAERQKPFQPAHLEHVKAAVCRGEMLLGGSLDNPDDGSALMLFQADSPIVVEVFATTDPYVLHEIVTRWHVRTWATVVGAGAAVPLPG